MITAVVSAGGGRRGQLWIVTYRKKEDRRTLSRFFHRAESGQQAASDAVICSLASRSKVSKSPCGILRID
jgi:hypothetical protein